MFFSPIGTVLVSQGHVNGFHHLDGWLVVLQPFKTFVWFFATFCLYWDRTVGGQDVEREKGMERDRENPASQVLN